MTLSDYNIKRTVSMPHDSEAILLDMITCVSSHFMSPFGVT